VNDLPWLAHLITWIGKPGPVTRPLKPLWLVVQVCPSSASGHLEISPTGLSRPVWSTAYGAQMMALRSFFFSAVSWHNGTCKGRVLG
jgi:hypothetical protein